MQNVKVDLFKKANMAMLDGAYNKAVSLYDKVSNHRPGNHWARANAVMACIKRKDYIEADFRLKAIEESGIVGTGVIGTLRELIDAKLAKASEGIRFKVPVDYLRYTAKGHLLPNLKPIKATEKHPSRFPYEMKLPKVVGNKNDFHFIMDATRQLYGQGSLPQGKVFVVIWVDDQNDLDAVLQNKFYQTAPRDRYRIALAGRAARKAILTGYGAVDLVSNGDPWRADWLKVLARQNEECDHVAFCDALTAWDPTFIERIIRQLAVYHKVVLPLQNVLEHSEGASPPTVFSNGPLLELWRRERYPFRRVKSLEFAMPLALLEEVGGFDAQFKTPTLAAKELCYRAYNAGAYFIPLAVKATTDEEVILERLKAQDIKADKRLFKQLCPAHWYRKRDGVYKRPKVSIYIPAYNAERYITDAIDSVLTQDFEDLEVCVHIDGVVDGTPELLERRYGEDPRIRWEVSENGGIGAASNRAVAMSRGLYVGQLDADDRLKPGAIRKLVAYLDEHAETGCVYSSCERVDAEGNYLMDEYSFPTFSREKMMITSITHHFRMFRRQAWARTEGFREDITNAVDYDFFLKLSEVTKFYHLNETLYERRWHGENTSVVNEDKQTENTYVVQNKALERLGLEGKWRVKVPDPSKPREISYERVPGVQRIFNWPDYSRANPYQRLLYSKVESCELYNGDIQAAMRAVDVADNPSDIVFHLHWLNRIVNGCETADELNARFEQFYADLCRFKAAGGTIIWTLHNLVSHEAKFPTLEVFWSQRIIGVVDHVHVHSRLSMNEVANYYEVPESKVVNSLHGDYQGYYPNYINRSIAREALGLNPDDRVLLFFGQIRPYKGFEALVDTFAELLEGYDPNLKLLVAGKANYDVEAYIGSVLGPESSNLLVYNEFVSDEEVQVFFKAADVAVFPYKNILTSGSVMLAMTFGICPVAPGAEMIKETVARSGLGLTYGPDSDYESLYDVVRAALDGEAQRQVPAPECCVWDGGFHRLPEGREGASL